MADARWIRESPTAVVGGVKYALVYGDGFVWIPEAGGYGPVYVWVAKVDPDYVAPPHVQIACHEYLDLAQEAEWYERAAGWDPNP